MKSMMGVLMSALLLWPVMLPTAASAALLIDKESESWRFTNSTSAGAAWTGTGYDDSDWALGQTSIGYGDNDDNTVLSNMVNRYSSLYLRHAFTISRPESVDYLILSVYFDDAFIAYINGTEVARYNVQGGTVLGQHEAIAYENFVIQPDRLVAGTNILALHGLNYRVYDSDFSIDAQLVSVPEPATLLLLALSALQIRTKSQTKRKKEITSAL